MTKIIGIGLPRTGNVTLATCIKILYGETTLGWNKEAAKLVMDQKWPEVKKIVENHNCLVEFPWASIFQQIERWYPESFFILTIRDTDKWLESVCRQFDKQKNPETAGGADFRNWFFGGPFPDKNKSKYVERYKEHNQAVKSYFGNKKNFLVVDWQKDGWEKICYLFEKDIPNQPLPHMNKGTIHGKEIMHL
jgi:hypothetical protein